MKGYIFDLDGTLVDSMWVWEDLAAVYLQTKGIKAEENLSKELQLMTMTDAIRYLKEKYVIQDSLAQVRTEVYAIEMCIRDRGYIHPELKEKGKLCIMSLTDGATLQDTKRIPFKLIMRPMYPLDDM